MTTATLKPKPYGNQTSLPRLVEDVIDDVVETLADDIERLMDDFMPDGVAFGQQKLSEREAMKRYLDSGLHSDPQACGQWLQSKHDALVGMLTTLGVPPDAMAQVHVWEIVLIAGLKMSAQREKQLGREAGKAWAAQPLDEAAPFVPEYEMGMNDAGSTG